MSALFECSRSDIYDILLLSLLGFFLPPMYALIVLNKMLPAFFFVRPYKSLLMLVLLLYLWPLSSLPDALKVLRFSSL